MNKKYLILIIIGTLSVSLIGGCSEKSIDPPPKGIVGESDSRLAIFDTATIEATVISLTLNGEERPDDTGIIRIDMISNYERNLEANYEPLSKEIIGTEITAKFSSSARPAIIRCDSIPIAEPEGSTANPRSEDVEDLAVEPANNVPSPENSGDIEPIPKEGEYFIYTYYTGTCPEDVILPGLSEGDKIRFPIVYSGTFSFIGEYEIIS